MAIATGSPLHDLAQWYAETCDGTWEHQHGISIQSTDNPGWWVKIDLVSTPLSGRPFADVARGIDEDGHPAAGRWLRCHLVDGTWHGAGDETRLTEIIERFLTWAG